MSSTYILMFRMRNEPVASVSDVIKQAIGTAFLTEQTYTIHDQPMTLQWQKTAQKQRYTVSTDADTAAVSAHNNKTLFDMVDAIRNGDGYASLRAMPGYTQNWQIILYLSKEISP